MIKCWTVISLCGIYIVFPSFCGVSELLSVDRIYYRKREGGVTFNVIASELSFSQFLQTFVGFYESIRMINNSGIVVAAETLWYCLRGKRHKIKDLFTNGCIYMCSHRPGRGWMAYGWIGGRRAADR